MFCNLIPTGQFVFHNLINYSIIEYTVILIFKTSIFEIFWNVQKYTLFLRIALTWILHYYYIYIYVEIYTYTSTTICSTIVPNQSFLCKFGCIFKVRFTIHFPTDLSIPFADRVHYHPCCCTILITMYNFHNFTINIFV